MNPNTQEKNPTVAMIEACIVGMEAINSMLLKRYDKIEEAEEAMALAFPQTRDRINAVKLALTAVGLEICTLIQTMREENQQEAAHKASEALVHALAGPELAEIIMDRAKEKGII